MSDFKTGGTFGGSFGGTMGGGTMSASANAAPSAPTPAPSGDLIKDSSDTAFAADVIKESSNQVVLVDFWAPWCGPCKQLTPAIEAAVKKANGAVKLVKVNIDENPQMAGQMGIQSIPAVVAFKEGRPVDGFMGTQTESQLSQFIERVAGPAGPSPVDEALKQGEALLEAEDFQQAAGLFSMVLQQDATSIAAVAGLARAAIGLGDHDQAEQMLGMVPEDAQNDPAILAVKAQIELLTKAEDTGEVDALRAKLSENEDDHQTRFDLALALNASGKRQDAATELLEIFRRDRSWNDDGARKELLTFFEAWGPKDDATKAARRALSSMLFS